MNIRSSSFKKFLILLLTVVFSLWALWAVYSSYQAQHALLVTSVPTEVSTTVSNKQLRLIAFRHELRTNPPFSLSGTDLQALKLTVDELEKSAIALSELYKTKEEKTLVRNKLYPIDFMRSLIEAETKRRDFVESPSSDLARAYLEALTTALTAYKNHLSELTDVISVSRQFPYGLIDGSVENHDLLVWFAQLQALADAGLSWAQVQHKCLTAYVVSCNSHPQTPAIKEERNQSTSTYSVNELTFADAFATAESQSLPAGGNGESLSEMPLIEYQGFCTQEGTARHARVWWNALNDSGLPYVRFVYVDEPLFYNHVDNSSDFSSFMVSQGIPYQHQPVNHYLCNHYGQELTTLTNTYSIWWYVNNKQITNTHEDSLSQLRELENKLRQSTTSVAQLDVLAYIMEIQQVLATNDTNLDAQERAELEDLLLSYRDGSLFYEARLGSLLKLFEFSYANFKEIGTPRAEHLVIGFSAMPMTLLADSPMAIMQAPLPVKKYQLDSGYPDLMSGLETLSNGENQIVEPIPYLLHSLTIIRQLKRGQLKPNN